MTAVGTVRARATQRQRTAQALRQALHDAVDGIDNPAKLRHLLACARSDTW